VYARRRHRYFAPTALCLPCACPAPALSVGAWAFVRLWSVPPAVGMCVVAMTIPPIAAVVANRREPDDRWWDGREHPRER
jgi:hypothetical protein